MGPVMPPFWTSGDICPEFQSQDGFPYLHALSPVHNGFLRFTSGMTPADLHGSQAVSSMYLHLHTSIAGAQVQNQACHCLTPCDKTDALPTELCWLS